jgi:hypothetical protein
MPSAQANSDVERDSRAVSPEPAMQPPQSPVNQLTTPTQGVAEDNLYDATPRQSQFPVHEPQQQPQPQPQQQQQAEEQVQQQQQQYQQQQQQRQEEEQVQQQHTVIADRQPSPPQQRGVTLTDTPAATIIINGPTEPKSAGPSHELTRPQPTATVSGSPSPPLILAPPITISSSPSPPLIHRPPTTTITSPTPDHHSDVDDLDFDSDMESPIIQDASIATLQQASPTNNSTNSTTTPTPTGTTGTTTAAGTAPSQNGGAAAKDNVAIFERAKKKAEEQREAEMRLMMEEKIPVFDEDHMLGAKKRGEEERVQMSATSYPGQEWNPYGEGYESD